MISESPLLILGAFFALIAFLTKVLSDNWTKRKLIEARLPEDVVRALFRKETDPELFAALKWGIMLVFIGVALIAIQTLGYGPDDPFAWGLVILFAGSGLVTYYLIARVLLRGRDGEGQGTGNREQRTAGHGMESPR